MPDNKLSDSLRARAKKKTPDLGYLLGDNSNTVTQQNSETVPQFDSVTVTPYDGETVEEQPKPKEPVLRKVSFYPTEEYLDKLDRFAMQYSLAVGTKIDRQDIFRWLVATLDYDTLLERFYNPL